MPHRPRTISDRLAEALTAAANARWDLEGLTRRPLRLYYLCMSIVKMNDPVEVAGEVTTIARLADEGRIVFRAYTTTTRKRQGERRERVMYVAEMRDTGEGWEIGKLAYLSRTKQPIEV